MTTKYIAKLDGRIVGKRTSKSRTYTHAVVMIGNEAPYTDKINRAACEEDRANWTRWLAGDRERGKFEPHVVAWAGRLDLAEKEARSRSASGFLRLVAIVPAEVV